MRSMLMPALLALALSLAACASRNEAAPAPSPDPAHSSRNALDWAGVYEGVLPCAGCPGVRTRLTLRRDGSFALSSQAVGRDAQPRVAQGRFTWQASGNAIVLDAAGGGQQVLVGEGRVALLDAGAVPNWAQAGERTLQRVAAPSPAEVQRTLESHRWTLASATDARGQAVPALAARGARPVVLSFAGGRLNVEGGCNRSFGAYRIDDQGRLAAGRMASTMMACEPEAMKIDSALAELLAEPLTIELTQGAAPALRLVTPAGSTLALAGQTTPEARYGAPARVFLEVAAQTVACPQPPAGASACLQVRELQFDAQGLRTGTPGAWQPMAEPIEGYRHESGVRNVLRLKRFDRGAAAGAPRYLFVLDLVVESEIVKR